MMNMACTLFGLTPAEALRATTIHAARALAMEDRRGSLAPGKAADFVVWDVADPAELSYRIGGNPCRLVVKDGAVVRGYPE
jgi:imidazolonepropionase